jgi:hypothetical protein
MPATPAEAEAILTLCRDYLPPDRLRELLRRLDEDVGQKSGSWSLRETLGMLRAMGEGL